MHLDFQYHLLHFKSSDTQVLSLQSLLSTTAFCKPSQTKSSSSKALFTMDSKSGKYLAEYEYLPFDGNVHSNGNTPSFSSGLTLQNTPDILELANQPLKDISEQHYRSVKADHPSPFASEDD